MLQPPVVLHSGTAEQQLNGLRSELQPEEQRGDLLLPTGSNKQELSENLHSNGCAVPGGTKWWLGLQ